MFADQIDGFMNALSSCISYELVGWLIEVLYWFHQMIDLQGHLARGDPKYPSYKRMNQFHSFLQLFKDTISGQNLETIAKPSRWTEGDTELPDNILNAITTVFSTMEKGWSQKVLPKLHEKIEWLLRYLPTIVSPYHPDFQFVIIAEASERFIYHLLQENPWYGLAILAGKFA